MSGRKRTKRKNSDEDFDVDEGDDGLDIDDINKWACHSCTFVNRAAAFRCFVCGTRKGTSTRRSRCNDNVVEMQKSITDMVQKQVEKEKSLKRKERSMMKSVTRDDEETTSSDVKAEELDVSLEHTKIEIAETPVETETTVITTPVLKFEPQEEQEKKSPVDKMKKERKNSEIHKKSLKISRESTSPQKNGATVVNGVFNPYATPAVEKRITPEKQKTPISSTSTSFVSSPHSIKAEPGLQLRFGSGMSDIKIEVAPDPQPAHTLMLTPTTSINIPKASTTTKICDESILQHLPERIVKKINQPYNNEILKAHVQMTGIDPIVANSEAVLLPQDWDRQKVMKGLALSLGSSHTVSPTTSRQSSETDSSSSDGNRSFETPINDAPPSVSKSCQIPDYMIHREAPRKIFIVANGFPAFFEEFPRRV